MLGKNALHLAVLHNRFDVVKWLLSQSDITVSTQDNEYVLRYDCIVKPVGLEEAKSTAFSLRGKSFSVSFL